MDFIDYDFAKAIKGSKSCWSAFLTAFIYAVLVSVAFTKLVLLQEKNFSFYNFSIIKSAINLECLPFPFAKQCILTKRCLKRIAVSCEL